MYKNIFLKKIFSEPSNVIVKFYFKYFKNDKFLNIYNVKILIYLLRKNMNKVLGDLIIR